MEKVDLATANEKLQQVRETSLPAVGGLPFELLNRRSNKTTKLVANSGDDTPMNGANRWFEYEFTEPVFLCEISVNMENYGSYDTFEFQWITAQGGTATQDVNRESDNLYTASINQLVRGVSFKPPKKWWTAAMINSVTLKGFKPGELEEFVHVVSRLDRLKNDIVATGESAIQNAEKANEDLEILRQEKDQLTGDVTIAKTDVTDLNNQIGRLTEERNGILADIKKREDSISSLNEQEVSIKERLTERNAERSVLAGQITEQKQELRSLQNDINMFPTEISGFVSQAAQNTKTYWRLAWVPILLLVLVTGLLVFNAANLTTVVDETDNARIFSILVTRLPYVVITTAIIGAAYKLAAVFIAEIMRINQQRLNLSKVSIIAADVSKASEEDLSDLSDEEVYGLRTRLKMDMLRDHMKEYLSKDFTPSKKRPEAEKAEPAESEPSNDEDDLVEDEET